MNIWGCCPPGHYHEAMCGDKVIVTLKVVPLSANSDPSGTRPEGVVIRAQSNIRTLQPSCLPAILTAECPPTPRLRSTPTGQAYLFLDSRCTVARARCIQLLTKGSSITWPASRVPPVYQIHAICAWRGGLPRALRHRGVHFDQDYECESGEQINGRERWVVL